MNNPIRYFNSSPEVIRLAVTMVIRYPLSLRQVEDILFERCIDICHETVHCWWNRFGPMFAGEIRRRRAEGRNWSNWRWHLDEVFATKRRDRRAVLKFLKRTMKRYGRPWSIVTDALRSYSAAMKALGNPGLQECGCWLNNRAENSHQPFRRREAAMARFRDIKALQTFTAVHASIHNHFNRHRRLTRRDIFKLHRAAAVAEWRQLAAGESSVEGFTSPD